MRGSAPLPARAHAPYAVKGEFVAAAPAKKTFFRVRITGPRCSAQPPATRSGIREQG
eukprot:gene8952-1657_t